MASRSKSADNDKPAPERQDRLKAALKANMAKRKAQARARAEADGTGDAGKATGKNKG